MKTLLTCIASLFTAFLILIVGTKIFAVIVAPMSDIQVGLLVVSLALAVFIFYVWGIVKLLRLRSYQRKSHGARINANV